MHPTDGLDKHELYLLCDDIDKTLAELTDKGVPISQGVSDRGWGLIASICLTDADVLHPIEVFLIIKNRLSK